MTNTSIKSHSHKWTIVIDEAYVTEFPSDIIRTVIAVCECGAKLSTAEIEQVLDGG